MRLKVTGVETLEVVPPRGYNTKKKVIDPVELAKLKGQTFTTEELKDRFGYARTTALADTQLARHIEQADTGKRKPPATNVRALWRVK